MKFSPESVAAFIAVLGILSIIAQVSLLLFFLNVFYFVLFYFLGESLFS